MYGICFISRQNARPIILYLIHVRSMCTSGVQITPQRVYFLLLTRATNKRAAQEKQGYFGVIYTVLWVLEKALVQYKWRAQWAQCPGPFPRVPISRICSLRGPSKWTRGPLRKSIRRGKKKKVVKAECWLCCIHASTPTTTRFLVVLVSPSSVRYLIRWSGSYMVDYSLLGLLE